MMMDECLQFIILSSFPPFSSDGKQSFPTGRIAPLGEARAGPGEGNAMNACPVAS
jgi:hypothetical protein